MRNLDNQDRGEGLPCELSDWGDGSNQRILIPGEMGVFLEAEESSIAQNALIQDLKEIDPHENGKNDLVSLASNSFIL